MIDTYHYSLALLALVVASTLAYQALDTSVRIAASRESGYRLLWLVVGTPTMGLGLLGMHFVAMLAWMPSPVVAFYPGWGVAAGLAAMVTSYGLLRLGSAPSMTPTDVTFGAFSVGVAAVAMHYLNLASIGIYPGFTELFLRVGVTVACGVLALIAAVRILRSMRHPRRERWFLRRLLTAIGMAVVISPLMHVALGAAIMPLHLAPAAGASSELLWLGGTVGFLSLFLMLSVVALSHHGTRLFLRAQRLSGSVDRLHDRIEHLAMHDPLTGLPNRSMLVRQIDHALIDANAGAGHLAVIYLDLDGFKTINDTLGHAFGDDLLRAVAQRLEIHLRSGSLARFGGDEFVAVLDRMRSPESALVIVQRLISAMQQDFFVNGTAVRVTPSVGLAFYPQDGDNVEDLIAHADVAMYGTKEGGRNGYRVYDVSMKQRATRILAVQHGLRTAIEDGSLSLHFQPKHDGPSGVVVGAEALARWHHPELGVVSPDEFIAVAERSGQIVKLGEWVIRETCRQLCEWRDRGLPVIRVAINLSPLQLNQPDMLEMACRIVSDAGLVPAQIMFEMTESLAMQDAERTTALLREFRERGFDFAIDDFGTGYSSLAYLQKFQARQLKIDRFFIQALDQGGPEARAIITAIIALAHTLNMEVVAEGVETVAQAEQLRTLGCDQIQGFLLSKPMPPLEFERRCLTLDMRMLEEA
ncbi:MAG: EAL domain-containing protein [Rhodanobacter sp.]|nr:MAG: EAL domain-containing protein [Rhodanobacter sp.]